MNKKITVRKKELATNNAIKQGLMKKNPDNYKYLYTKYYNLDNTHHDIFLNKTTGDYESIMVEPWNTDEQE